MPAERLWLLLKRLFRVEILNASGLAVSKETLIAMIERCLSQVDKGQLRKHV